MRFALLMLFTLLTFLPPAFAARVGSPYRASDDARFDALENGSGIDSSAITNAKIAAEAVTEDKVLAQSADGVNFGRWARASFSAIGGSVTIGAQTIPVNLPAKAVIIRSFIRVTTQFADTGTCTVALSCEDANNIKTATDITGSAAGAFIEGQSTGAASAFVASIGAACSIVMTIADGGSCVPSAGAGTVWVNYLVHN